MPPVAMLPLPMWKSNIASNRSTIDFNFSIQSRTLVYQFQLISRQSSDFISRRGLGLPGYNNTSTSKTFQRQRNVVSGWGSGEQYQIDDATSEMQPAKHEPKHEPNNAATR